MAPTDAPFPSSGVSARRWARVKNTARGVPNRSVDEDEERSARLSLRRAHSDSSIGALHSVCDLSTSASSREGSVVDAAAQRGGRALNEALLWADMEDDEPFLLDWPGSPSAKAAAQHQSHLCGWLPFAGEKKVPALPWPPSQPCGPPSPQQRHALLVGCAAAPQRPLEGAGARTPLSSRSRPYVPWIPLGASAPEPKDSARPVGVDAKGEGGKVEAQSQSRPEGQTTVMLRGLPGSYSREQLVRLLDARGYSGLFNFVYLPVNFESSQAAGYAFINWTRADIAESFKESFEGLTCHPFSSSRPCSASWSRVQGLSANVKQYRNSPVMHEQVPDEYKPVLLWNGLRRAFPGPTTTLKELKKPRRTPCSECCPEGPAGQPLYLADA